MGIVSGTRKEITKGDGSKPRSGYLTTTELARLCGVSRFTIINWTNRGKIRGCRTVGGHYRIPVSEAISFLESFHLETFHKVREGVASGLLGHCWEYLQKTNCDKECKNCLIYGREIDYCFVLVQQFGKEVIRCKGDCLNCSYFNEFFSSYSKKTQFEEPRDKKSKVATTKKKSFLYNFVYGIGRGVHILKERR